jgi:trehalose 6-phosphate synthase/phosphatase
MKRLIFVSNRLPVSIDLQPKKISVTPSVGGLATGLKSFYKNYDSQWIGWAGIDRDALSDGQVKEVNAALEKEKCAPVYLDPLDVEQYYYGFSNKTIWPLFHYFTQYTEYLPEFWESYKNVNEAFAKVVLKNVKEGDTIWIHDYHLLLLPQLIREKTMDVSIGFFLHIPFPSFEVFRLLPWRNQILEGLLGADLIGFHTYDYERHFISSVRRLVGHDVVLGEINLGDRIVKVDSYPMGIDFDKFNDAVLKKREAGKTPEASDLKHQMDEFFSKDPHRKLILSIDRLDYSKGIPNRLIGFRHFLDQHPEYHGKVTLVMLAVPSRTHVEHYQIIRSEVDELVGQINGKFARINWTPIWYFYRSLPFDNLVDLYSSCEIGLVTPVRDGMNLIAKEYLASRPDGTGVLILSEMAGAYRELSEALIINPNNIEDISNGILQALKMKTKEQVQRNTKMRERIRRYNVEKWAIDFLESLEGTTFIKERHQGKKINARIQNDLIKKYRNARKRILIFDYDSGLFNRIGTRKKKLPENHLYKIMDRIHKKQDTEIVLVSGKTKNTIHKLFRDKEYTLIVEHGIMVREPGKDWKTTERISKSWKEYILPILEFYVDRTPGTFIEMKKYSLAWHYRKADPELGPKRAVELKDDLMSFLTNHNLEIIEGNKAIDIKPGGISKERSIMNRITSEAYDFILVTGDDWTVDHLFEELKDAAITLKVGSINTRARYIVPKEKDLENLLQAFMKY